MFVFDNYNFLGIFLCLFTFEALSESRKKVTWKGLEKTNVLFADALFADCHSNLEEKLQETPKLRAVSKLNNLRQCILNSRLFYSVVIAEIDLNFSVTVEEKWSLIPIPYFSVGSSSQANSGLFLLDTNFLGLGKILVAGGTFGSDSSTYIASYQDSSVGFSKWFAGLGISRSKKDIDHYSDSSGTSTDQTEDDPFHFTEELFSTRASVGYTFSVISPSVFISSKEKKVRGLNGLVVNSFSAGNRLEVNSNSIGMTLNYSDTSYKLYYAEGLRLAFSLEKEVLRKSEGLLKETKPLSTSVLADYSAEIYEDQALVMKIDSGHIVGGGDLDLIRKGAGKGFRGSAAESIWTRHYANASVSYQVPVANFESSTATTAPFIEAGVFEKANSNEKVSYNAWGVGAYIFLKKVAIPGLGIEVGRSNKFERNFINISLGLSL